MSLFESPMLATKLLRYGTSLILRQSRFTRVATVPYFDGRARIAADLRTSLGLDLYRNRRCDPSVRLMALLLRTGDMFVDAGAHVGLFTLAAAAVVGATGRGVIFEPSPGTHQRLAENIRRNRFDWVAVHNAALAEEAGHLAFVTFDDCAASHNSFAPETPDCGTHIEVTVTTLDKALANEPIERLRVMKIDVEGAELRALQGARRVLEAARPSVLLELEALHLARQGATPDDIVRFFADLSYTCFRPAPKRDGSLCLRLLEAPASREFGPNILAVHASRLSEVGNAVPVDAA